MYCVGPFILGTYLGGSDVSRPGKLEEYQLAGLVRPVARMSTLPRTLGGCHREIGEGLVPSGKEPLRRAHLELSVPRTIVSHYHPRQDLVPLLMGLSGAQ